jgi:hypothetical protein
LYIFPLLCNNYNELYNNQFIYNISNICDKNIQCLLRTTNDNINSKYITTNNINNNNINTNNKFGHSNIDNNIINNNNSNIDVNINNNNNKREGHIDVKGIFISLYQRSDEARKHALSFLRILPLLSVKSRDIISSSLFLLLLPHFPYVPNTNNNICNSDSNINNTNDCSDFDRTSSNNNITSNNNNISTNLNKDFINKIDNMLYNMKLFLLSNNLPPPSVITIAESVGDSIEIGEYTPRCCVEYIKLRVLYMIDEWLSELYTRSSVKDVNKF